MKSLMSDGVSIMCSNDSDSVILLHGQIIQKTSMGFLSVCYEGLSSCV